MEHYSFVAAMATLFFLAAVLIVEYVIRRRELNRDLVQNQPKQQQLAAYSAELKDLKKAFPVSDANAHRHSNPDADARRSCDADPE